MKRDGMKHTVQMLAAGMGLALLGVPVGAGIVSCGRSHGPQRGVVTAGDADSVAPGATELVTEAIAAGDAAALAALTAFPIERPYPLRQIEDSIQLVRYFPIMVDDSLRHVCAVSKPTDWTQAGWRGWTLLDGRYLWVDDGALYSVNYLSAAEQALLEALVDREMGGLDSTLATGWRPVLCLAGIDDGSLYRIDAAADSTLLADGMDYPDRRPEASRYRLTVFPRTYDLAGLPSVAMFGTGVDEGTAQSRHFHFRDKTGAEAEYLPDMTSNEQPVITFRRPGGKDEDHPVKTVYWRDYFSEKR